MIFGYEKLEVWNKSVDFAVTVIDLIEKRMSKFNHSRLVQQIEASSTSIGMNIAEGKGRFSQKEYVHFLYIARGSLYETMTFLEIMKRKKWISMGEYNQIEKNGIEIASMIKGLINSIRG